MHVVFMTTDFIDVEGPTSGLPQYLFRTSRALIGMGNKVSVVACSNRTVEYQFYGINVYKVRKNMITKKKMLLHSVLEMDLY